jgi:hypothetical protein
MFCSTCVHEASHCIACLCIGAEVTYACSHYRGPDPTVIAQVIFRCGGDRIERAIVGRAGGLGARAMGFDANDNGCLQSESDRMCVEESDLTVSEWVKVDGAAKSIVSSNAGAIRWLAEKLHIRGYMTGEEITRTVRGKINW